MTTSTPTGQICSEPLPWETLVDYWIGELPDDEAAALEEHLFTCASCVQRLAALVTLIDGIRDVLGDADEQPVVRQEALDALIAQGKRIREWRISADTRITVTIPPDTDFVVARLTAELADLDRLDVEFCGADGRPFYTVRDAPFDPQSGEVLVLCHRHVAESHPELVFRLLGTTSGSERKATEYALVNATS